MRLVVACLVAGVVLLAGAESASAVATWYTSSNSNGSGCTQFDQCKTIAQSVAKASDGDTIRIAGGDYQESVSTAKRLTFDGNGFGHPPFFLDGTTIHGQSSGPALRLQGGGTVRDLRVVGANTASPNIANLALVLDSAGAPGLDYAVANVVATAGAVASPAGSGQALSVQGTAALTVHVSDSFLFGRPGDGVTVYIAPPGASTAVLDRVNIDAGGATEAIRTSSVDGDTTINGGTIKGAADKGLFVFGGTTSVNGATITSQTHGAAVTSGAASTLNVRDSLIRADATAAGADGLSVKSTGGSQTVNITGSTVVARGPSPDAGLLIQSTGHSSTVHAVATAFRAIPTDAALAPDVKAEQSGTGQVVFDPSHSYFGTVGNSGVTLPAPGSGTNVSGDPGFADPAGGDYRLAPGSGLVDRGDPAAVNNGELDLAGSARSLDGDGNCLAVPDIGAYERPAVAANCPGGGADKVAPVISRASFKPHRLKAGKRGQLRLRLSEKAKLTVLVKRRKGKHHKRVSKLTKTGGPGALSLRLGAKLKTGRYRLALGAVDAAGNRSRTIRVNFRVVRA
jgi:hypothetical protein